MTVPLPVAQEDIGFTRVCPWTTTLVDGLCMSRVSSFHTVSVWFLPRREQFQSLIGNPSGTVVFACHKIEGAVPDSHSDTPYMSQSQAHYEHTPQDLRYGTYPSYILPENAREHPPPLAYPGYGSSPTDVYTVTYGMPGTSAPHAQSPATNQTYAQQWVEGQLQQRYSSQHSHHDEWRESPSPPGTSPEIVNSRSIPISTPDLHHQQLPQQQQTHWTGHTSSYVEPVGEYGNGPNYHHSPTNNTYQHHQSDSYNPTMIPSPVSPTIGLRDSLPNQDLSAPPSETLDSMTQPIVHRQSPEGSSSTGRTSREHANGPGPGSAIGLVGRAVGAPPAGVVRCSSCKTTTSPEWRKGPSGRKELCNAYVVTQLHLNTI